MAEPKFKVGQVVRIVKLLNPSINDDVITSETLIGKVEVISEVDPLPNGEYNYQVGPHYMHEAELEVVRLLKYDETIPEGSPPLIAKLRGGCGNTNPDFACSGGCGFCVTHCQCEPGRISA